jgi:hypothetical protein
LKEEEWIEKMKRLSIVIWKRHKKIATALTKDNPQLAKKVGKLQRVKW